MRDYLCFGGMGKTSRQGDRKTIVNGEENERGKERCRGASWDDRVEK